MPTEERIYKGDVIQKLLATVDRVRENDNLSKYVLANESGRFGVACEMLDSEAQMRNVRLAGAGSDYRWMKVGRQ